jgi:hypothetical protein
MNNLEKKIELVQRILTQSIEISNNSIIDIFVDFSSHVQGVYVRVHLKGWQPEADADIRKTIFLDRDNSEEELQDVIEYLETLREEK